MSLQLDDKEWEYHDEDGYHMFLHRGLDLSIVEYKDEDHLVYKYTVKDGRKGFCLYKCKELFTDDIDYIVRHYSMMSETYCYESGASRGETNFYCKVCKKIISEFIYPHFRTHHDVVTKSANKT